MARMMAGACRVLELFIEPVRSSKGMPVAAVPLRGKDRSSGGCRMQPTTGLKSLQIAVFTLVDGRDFATVSALWDR